MDKKIIETTLKHLEIDGQTYEYFDINELEKSGYEVARLPLSIKVLLENALRNFDNKKVGLKHVENILNWAGGSASDEIAFVPARILLQDFTGVPAVVDLAAMRESVHKAGLDASLINPISKVDLVIDHSLIIDYFGDADAINKNIDKEYERNLERYKFLKWAKNSFDNFNVYEPGSGIIHQINLEKIATCVMEKNARLYPDTLVGTDSHTTMINGLGVFGFGVGGIEAESAMLAQPVYMTRPEVIGVRITGKTKEGVVATDVVLTVVEMLRRENVVGKIVEYFGAGVAEMSIPDRATLANMAPEYGATAGFFPVDKKTIDYLRLTGRVYEAEMTQAYYERQDMFGSDREYAYTKVLELDLSTVETSMAGHKRPQDKIVLSEVKHAFRNSVLNDTRNGGLGLSEEDLTRSVSYEMNGKSYDLKAGDVVMASITSCTNTSNPQVLIGAGLIAKKAVELGLKVPNYVKTSLAPGSRAVTNYLDKAGLLTYLENLGFNVVGYGCATCIGNGGLLVKEVEEALAKDEIVVASVVSGNRNFEGRIHQRIKTNYLASPMLVLIYALKGKLNVDIAAEPIGVSKDGREVYLKDLWPKNEEIEAIINDVVTKEVFEDIENTFASKFEEIKVGESELYDWEDESTYIRLPDFFDRVAEPVQPLEDIKDLKVLAVFGDSVTTDHISPAGAIAKSAPAAKYLLEKGVEQKDFNSYGSRRGNHEVMMRGTFANIRVRNLLADGREGGYTKDDKGEVVTIYDRAMELKDKGLGAIVIAGKEYGTGSSRDWAAKGPSLLGVKVVIARSFERIHRSNLIGMGVLPLEFLKDQDYDSLELKNYDNYSIIGLGDTTRAGDLLEVVAENRDGDKKRFQVKLRIDSEVEKDYYRNGGILHTLIKEMIN